MAITLATVAFILMILILVLFLIGLCKIKRGNREIAWSLYIPILSHFICNMSLLIETLLERTLVSNYNYTSYALMYGLSVASFYYILIKRLALMVVNTVYQWSKPNFYSLSLCLSIAGLLSMLTIRALPIVTLIIIFCIFIVHFAVIREICKFEFIIMKKWKLRPFIITKTFQYNTEKMELMTIGYIKKELIAIDSNIHIPFDVVSLIYNHYLYITYDKEVNAYKRDIEVDYEKRQVPKHIQQFHSHLWKMVILSSVCDIVFLTIMILYTIAFYRADYIKFVEISLNIVVPILLVIGAFCLLVSLK